MKIWFDTEFIEDGKTIDLVSIGMVREDGATYYAETDGYAPGKADDWVRENVLAHLRRGDAIKPRDVIAREIIEFAGEEPEFWAYYADYDWVVLCQLFGRMIDLPEGWPMFCRDIKQLCVDLGDPKLPQQNSTEHHALEDARWNREAWLFLADRARAPLAAPVAERWNRADGDSSILLYTLVQDGWRKGEPLMVNDVMVRIEKARRSETPIEPIAELIISALAAPGTAPSGTAEVEPVAWVPEDELPESLPTEAYNALFPYSRVDGIRLFPIFAPTVQRPLYAAPVPPSVEVREPDAELVLAARNILPYLNWTIGPESPGQHPTMLSAVEAFKAASTALAAYKRSTTDGKS